MTDLRDRLDDLVAREGFEPLDPTDAIVPGRRALRRRRLTTALGAAAAVVVAALVVSVAVRWVSQPAVEFGDPAGRRPATGGVSHAEAFPDLVTSRRGDDYVEIAGFGWPLAEMDPDDISKLDAESMCLPMLGEAAPEVPASAWRHSESWVDSFPSRATLPTTMEAEHDGRSYSATCTLPGDYVPLSRPDLASVPDLVNWTDIREQCSYLGHLDLSDTTSDAAASGVGGTIAVLGTPDGGLVTCVLTQSRAGRAVQLSEDPRPLTAEDSLVLHRSGRSALVAGIAPEGATDLELRLGDQTGYATAIDGVFAIATPLPAKRGGTARLTAYDAAGDEIASWSSSVSGPEGALLPPLCFYSLETGNDGC